MTRGRDGLSEDELFEQLEAIEDADWEEREEFRKKIVKSFTSQIKPGRELSKEARKKLRKSLAYWGLTPEDFAETVGISVYHMWEAFMTFMTKALKGEIKSHREHMAKLLASTSAKKIPIRKFIETETGLVRFNKLKIEPWLTQPDKAYFLEQIGEPLINSGVYLHSKSSKIYYVPSNSLAPDQHVTYKEGLQTKTLRLARLYEIELEKSGVVYILVGLPLDVGRESGGPGVTHQDYLIADERKDLAIITDELEELYYNNCLFKNKITRINCSSNNGLEFDIKDVPNKPSILDKQKQSRFDHIKNVIEHWDKLDPGERKMGLILYGPPGGGKTASISSLLRSVHGKATVFFVNNMHPTLLAQLYPWLERIGPNIIIYEDMDGIQVRRDGLGYDSDVGFISLLLEVLDGDKEYDVITIATTNYPERFDPAMLRPGRLGTCIEYSPPNDELKLEIIEFYLDKYDLKDVFQAEDLLQDFFNHSCVLGVHIAMTLKDVSVKTKLGADHGVALMEAASEYMSEESLGWQRQSVGSNRLGFNRG